MRTPDNTDAYDLKISKLTPLFIEISTYDNNKLNIKLDKHIVSIKHIDFLNDSKKNI
ncbi:hypothetical protein NMY25_000754 [Wohlfahrtiimonas chitiniclastica]|nr:hypothetical protein [Wohlfahrtiimonas chitiniclastica]